MPDPTPTAAGRGERLTPLIIADSGILVQPISDDPDDMVMAINISLPADEFGIQDAVCTNVSLDDALRLLEWLTYRLLLTDAGRQALAAEGEKTDG